MKNTQKKRHPIIKIFFTLSAALLCILLGTGLFLGVKGYHLYRQTVSEKSLEARVDEVRNKESFTPYSELPEFYVNATLAVEDHRFRKHEGIDFISIARAAWTDIKAGAYEEGGSTITQQLVKNLMFTREKKMERKVAEAFAALEMESKYTKDEIFEVYANIIDFGGGYDGIKQASRGYFGKDLADLTDYECAMLAGIPNYPSAYSPAANKELAEKRVVLVLDCMRQYKMITNKESQEIKNTYKNK